MSSDLLIDELSADLTPVRRRSLLRETVWLAALGLLEVSLFLAAGLMRKDMSQAILHPFMWWKLGSLAILVLVSASTAIRSFSPIISPRRGLGVIALLIGLAAVTGGVVGPGGAVAATVADRLSPTHGLVCATCIIVLSLPMLGILSLLMRKGASTHAEGSALAVGLAGGSWGAFVFAFCCPVNDPLYIEVWYSVACTIVVLVARFVLPRVVRL